MNSSRRVGTEKNGRSLGAFVSQFPSYGGDEEEEEEPEEEEDPEEWASEEDPEEWTTEQIQEKLIGEAVDEEEPEEWTAEQPANDPEDEPAEEPATATDPQEEPEEWTEQEPANDPEDEEDPEEWIGQEPANDPEDEEDPEEWTGQEPAKGPEVESAEEPATATDPQEEEPEKWTEQEPANDPEDEEDLEEWAGQEPANEPEDEEDPEEWTAQEPANDPEDGEDPEEWTAQEPANDPEDEEDPEEWTAQEPANDPEDGKEPEEWTAQEPANDPPQPGERIAEEPANDPEDESEEEPEEWPVQDRAADATRSGMKTSTDNGYPGIEQPMGNLDDQFSGKSTSMPSSSGTYVNEADPWITSIAADSNEKKRAREDLLCETPIFPVNKAHKRHRREEFSESESDVGAGVVADLQRKPGTFEEEVCERDSTRHFDRDASGSSGKRKLSDSKGEPTSKRMKTQWNDEVAQLKMLGPLKLPDFKKGVDFGCEELEIVELQRRLIEINGKLQRAEVQDDRPENERSPSPEPSQNDLSIKFNTRQSRLRMKLIEGRQSIISSLIQKNPIFRTPPEDKPSKLFVKLYIPVVEYPTYNFIGLIMGPRGKTLQGMEKETGARIRVRGKGASRSRQDSGKASTDDLHVYIEADNQDSLDAAAEMVEKKLLIPFNTGTDEHIQSQLSELAKMNGVGGFKNMGKRCCEERQKRIETYPFTGSNTPMPRDSSSDRRHLSASSDTKEFSTVSKFLSAPSTIESSTVSNHLSASPGHGLTSTPISKFKPESNLYISNLPRAIDDDFLRDLFSPFGDIISVRVIKDKVRGHSKGYGFVQFENTDEAAMAVMHMNGYKLYGSLLIVRVAECQFPPSYYRRPAQGHHYRGGSRDHSVTFPCLD